MHQPSTASSGTIRHLGDSQPASAPTLSLTPQLNVPNPFGNSASPIGHPESHIVAIPHQQLHDQLQQQPRHQQPCDLPHQFLSHSISPIDSQSPHGNTIQPFHDFDLSGSITSLALPNIFDAPPSQPRHNLELPLPIFSPSPTDVLNFRTHQNNALNQHFAQSQLYPPLQHAPNQAPHNLNYTNHVHQDMLLANLQASEPNPLQGLGIREEAGAQDRMLNMGRVSFMGEHPLAPLMRNLHRSPRFSVNLEATRRNTSAPASNQLARPEAAASASRKRGRAGEDVLVNLVTPNTTAHQGAGMVNPEPQRFHEQPQIANLVQGSQQNIMEQPAPIVYRHFNPSDAAQMQFSASQQSQELHGQINENPPNKFRRVDYESPPASALSMHQPQDQLQMHQPDSQSQMHRPESQLQPQQYNMAMMGQPQHHQFQIPHVPEPAQPYPTGPTVLNLAPIQSSPPEQMLQQSQALAPVFSPLNPNTMVGRAGMPLPAPRPRGPKLKFQAHDDVLLIQLKERKNLTWKQIADFFPGRSSGTLQVRYCTKLKSKPTLWTSDLETKLATTLRDYRRDKWRHIASKVSNGFSAAACRAKAIELGLDDGNGEGEEVPEAEASGEGEEDDEGEADDEAESSAENSEDGNSSDDDGGETQERVESNDEQEESERGGATPETEAANEE